MVYHEHYTNKVEIVYNIIPYYTILYHSVQYNPHLVLTHPVYDSKSAQAVMISHAWDESFVDLLLALSVAPQKGPLWVREPGAGTQGGG